MGKRLESVAAAEVAEVVNRDNRQPFTAREIDSILRQMESDNRVMYTEGVVHII
eukprot:jgi/Mesen1/7123/ME000369S06455